MNTTSIAPPRCRRSGGPRQLPLLAAVLLGALLTGCTPSQAPPPDRAAPTATQNQATPPAAAASQPAPAPTPRQIRVAMSFISAESLPIWMAQEQRLFEKYGLEAEIVPLQGGGQVAAAMASGEVPIAYGTGAGIVEFALGGGDEVIVGMYNSEMRYFLQGRPEIRQVEDLRDKRVAITRHGGGLEFGLRLLHERHGLVYGRDSVVVELATAQNQLNGLVAGAVDAAFVSMPANFLAERQGFPLIEDTKVHHIPFPTNSIAVRRPYLAANEDIVRRYLQAHIEAVELTRHDKALAKRLLGQNTATDDDDILERSYAIYVQDLQDTPQPSAAAIQSVLDSIADEKPEARAARPADFYDDRLVRELEESGFIRSVRGG